MKQAFFILIAIISLNVFSQSEQFAGEYVWIVDTTNANFKYTLSLQPNGTFTFHSYTYHLQANTPESNKYGKGTWTVTKKNISFTTNSNTDFDNIYTLDLNNSKARYISKSPRDKSNSVVKTKIKFYTSNIGWIKGIEMRKL
ncbi:MULTISPECIES: hypothetical protein [unclassified Lacinutrix]